MPLTTAKGSVWNSAENNLAVNVKDFGAVGDGVTDDTAAIQAALDSASGDLYLPEGAYLISTTLADDLDVSISGGTLKTATQEQIILQVGSGATYINNLSIRDVTFENTGSGITNNYAPADIRLGNNCVIDNATFNGTYLGARIGYDGGANYSSLCKVVNSYFDNVTEMAIENIYANRNLISGNIINAPALGTGKWALRLTGNTATGVVCTDNIINSNGRGISVQADVDNNVVSNNYIENAQRGIELLAGASGNNAVGNVTYNCEYGAQLTGALGNNVNINATATTALGISVDGNSKYNNISGVINGTTGNDGLRVVSGSDYNNFNIVIKDAQQDGADIQSNGNTGYINIDEANLGLSLSGNYNNLSGQISNVASTELSVTGNNNILNFVVNGDVVFDAASSNNKLIGVVTGTITDNGTGNDYSGVAGYSDYGEDTISVDASGYATISHALTGLPTYITAMLRSTSIFFAILTAKTTSDFTVRIVDASGTPLTTGNYVVMWEAKR